MTYIFGVMKTKALIQITLIYLLIGVVGYVSYVGATLFDWNGVVCMLVADLIMTVVSYIFSLIKRNSSVYDAYWSVIPFYFLVFWFIEFNGQSWNWQQWLVFGAISWWSWRLTSSWARGWTGWHHEDWRYVNFRNQFGKHFEWVNFSAIHLFPTVIVFLGCIPLFWGFEFMQKEVTNWLVILGAGISIAGGFFEFFADNALAKFRHRENPKKGDILELGIWKYSRNPNYFGEMLFWIGCFVAGFGFGAPWYTAFGCIAMICMFIFASIPLKETRMLERRDNFQGYQKRVSILIPWKRK